MLSDLKERTWWIFKLPNATSYVPASNEEDARRKMAQHSYVGAPVHAWPLIGTRVCSREALTRSLLRKRS